MLTPVNFLIVVLLSVLLFLLFSIMHYVKYKYQNPISIDDVFLNNEELQSHARESAREHISSYRRRNHRSLSSRLNENYRFISNVYRLVIEDASSKLPVCPASEWLLDNFYVIEEDINALKLVLSSKIFRDLKYLDNGYLRNYPRIFAVTLEIVSHQDGKLEEDKLINFINAYQSQSYLTMPELWSLSPMFTIALIEKIRAVCEEIVEIQLQWKEVENLRGKNYNEILSIVLSHISSMKKIEYSYIEHLLRFFKREGLNQDVLHDALSSKLIEYDIDIEKVINREHQKQASLQISIGNCISSLRLIKSLEWDKIFESLSMVERILREDPSGVYIKQDFESRNYYRKRIEKISKKYNISEIRAAREAVKYARLAYENNNEFKFTHIGYYIIGAGKSTFLSHLKLKHGISRIKRHSLSLYLSFITIFSVAAALLLSLYSYALNNSIEISILVFILCLLPGSEIFTSIANWSAAHFVEASFLPKLEYKEGIPEDKSTIVIVPTILPSIKRAQELINQLEVTYLANREDNIYFALVGDYKDAITQHTQDDEAIKEAALNMIRKLNEKYKNGSDVFYLFLRHRTFSKSQGKWMGWERKRGSIVEFNNLLKGSDNTTYSTISGDIAKLRKVKYVITLDADTIMTIGTARKLIGTISHPLNSPIFDSKSGIVTMGHGIIQPRIGVNIESSSKSLFTRIFAGNGGIDTYTTAVSDVYQDLFDEGIFTGKGIYDIDVFKRALHTAIPENFVLSHDLLEGSYLRAGLAADIELIDGYPEKYSSYIMRLHRWVRGDWQLIRWLQHRLPNKDNVTTKNPLSILSRWKILDNMRRSLVPVSITFIIVLGLSILPGNSIVWLGYAIFTLLIPLIIGLLNYLLAKYYRVQRERINGNLILGIRAASLQILINFIFLPYFSYTMLNAVIKTLYRVYISKKNLLEWVTAADAEKNSKNDLPSYIMRMLPSLLCILLILILVPIYKPVNILPAASLLIIWGASPYIAYYISQPDSIKGYLPEEQDVKLLRRLCRKTWSFYEDFSGEDNNYLPVDNYQERPISRIAYRTSPTNIGFLLISVLAAGDLGYISTYKMLHWIDNTIRTIEKMDKWRGHLYNWYDTKTLSVLRPMYVSTVDSGNLVGYYMTLREGLLEYLKRNVVDKNLINGLMDTIDLYDSSADKNILSINNMLSNENFNICSWYNLLLSLKNHYKAKTGVNPKILDTVKANLKELEILFPSWALDSAKLTGSTGKIFKDIQAKNILKQNFSLTSLSIEYERLMERMEPYLKSNTCHYESVGELNGNVESSTEVADSNFHELLSAYNELKEALDRINSRISTIEKIIERIDRLVNMTEFAPLFDFKRGIFSIGYNIESDKLTNSYYDLLASEARITSYIAAARREIPPSHWFRLGRALTIVDGFKGLVSWTGTMFEYMMPPLIMKKYPNTLLSETYGTVIRAQMKYGKLRNVPWGTSESGYYTFDLNLNYQYRAFGVPELGLKRGLISDMVVSPYSTVLALPFSPKESLSNLKRLLSIDMEGPYGLYEAVDYTPERLDPKGREDHAIIRSYMAHHQGMILISLANFFLNNIMVNRFHSNPVIRAGEFMLQEKIPLKVLITKEHKEKIKPFERIEYEGTDTVRKSGLFDSPIPVCHLLTNGSYSLMINNSGSGYSKCDETMLTRWREDATSRKSGMFFYIKDCSTCRIWSSGFEPLNVVPDSYEAVFSQDKAEFIRRDGEIETHTEICVSSEDNCEIRRITIANHSPQEKIIECTSYFEVVMASNMADTAHPAFSNLFVRTEVLRELCSLIASRRPREEGCETLWSFHTLSVDGETIGDIEYETDRYRYIGRGHSVSNPISLYHPLSNTTGPVIDPVMSLRRRVKIPAGKSAVLSFTSGILKSREDVISTAKKYSDSGSISRAFELAYMRSQMETKYLNLKASDIMDFDDIVAHIVYVNPKRREYSGILSKNVLGQQNLWPYGISGDVPIVLVTIKDAEDIDVVKQMLKAHEYWRSKGLRVDMVILNEDESSYLQPLQELLRDVVFTSHAGDIVNKPGGIFIRNSSNIPAKDRILLYSAARILIRAELGSIRKQIANNITDAKYHMVNSIADNTFVENVKDEHPSYVYYNSFGGFDINNNEYTILLKEGINTPAPWSNIIANERFGFLITESGSGHTWFENSRENKLTPWSNDPVSDPPGEVIYICDEDTKEFWTITPLPIREKEDYEISHGLGYTIFRHGSHGINQALTVFVPTKDPVKISIVKLKNTANVKRRLSIFYYIRPVLGVTDQITQLFILTERRGNSGTILIKNTYSTDFPENTAFMGSSLSIESYTGDRLEFLGAYGSLDSPEGIKNGRLSNSLGAGFDPCCVLHSRLELNAHEEKEFTLLLGQDKSIENINALAAKYKNVQESKKALKNVTGFWKDTLGTLQVKTPDASMDLMLNYWLLYQNISCRLWARSAFYQSGGAYGFRDQLQDVLGVMHLLPGAARKQILLHCGHQFTEGDVQHWWHPGIHDKGIRTRFSDDLVWLPYVTSEYVEKTGDMTLLYEEVNYLEDAPLKEGEDERYGIPRVSNEKSSVYEHCIRAIERALKFGEHGIPLMGSGDWNDGMNTVGNKGRGESTWLGWFLCSTLKKFSNLCLKMNDNALAKRYIDTADEISKHLEENAWDGEWYRRAYFDDGTPLGSSLNSECKIDSLAQSWAVISGYGNKERALTAMKSLDNYLVDRNHGLILLFTPPFDQGELHPGYIKGYVPGVRENGGQYTHAATWVLYAYAKLGFGDRAQELFHLINPINHTRTHMECLRYKVEPYVIAADVYAVEPHTGRGGWTWYTGSAGWMYNVGIEQILGFNKKADSILFDPSIPADWKEYKISYRYNETIYNITVQNPNGVNKGVKSIIVDNKESEGNTLLLVNDALEHNVHVIMR